MTNCFAEEGLRLLNSLVPEDNPYAFELDEDGNCITPVLVLCKRNGDKINVIENATNIKQVFSFSSVFELSFDVSEYADNKRCSVWDDLTDFKLVYLPQYKLWFEIYVTTKDDNGLTKSVTGTHLNEAELSNVNLYGIEINTEDDLKLHDYAPTVFYNEENTSLSLLHRLLNKMPHYTIYHVDDSLKTLQRNFEFDGSSIMDAFDDIAEECDCVFIFGEGAEDDGSITRTVSVYDMLDVCQDCGERGEFDDGFCTECSSTNIKSRYGEDTNVFISNENLANEITYSNDTDSIKNCFHFEAGDDLMTAAIVMCNMGSSYVWYMPEETRRDMSPELQEALVKYDADSIYYTNENVTTFDSSLIGAYNDLVFKYKTKDENLETIFSITGYSPLVEAYWHSVDFQNYLQTSMMPTASLDATSASEQVATLTEDNMSPISVSKLSTASSSTISSAIKAYVKVYVDTSRYEIEVKNVVLYESYCTCLITLTSYSDEDDTASTALTIQLNDNLESFTKQKIDKLLAKSEGDDAPYGVVALFKLDLDAFKIELTNHSLDNLDMFYKCGEDVINLLIEDGHYSSDSELNKSLYIPSREKLDAIQDEINVRTNEVSAITNMENALYSAMSEINKKLSMESYLGDLWKEYISYRREDEYSNSNYISEGLTNKEVIQQAQLFYKAMMREIKKSATLQHSISTSLKNLMILPEFNPILYKFRLGNWLRVKIDGTIYKLRLDEYTIDYDDMDSIDVSFTDIRDQNSVIAQVRRTFAQSKAQSGSYSASTYQMVSNQTVVSTTTGVLVRNYSDDFSNFKTGQLRVLSSGIYYTDDNWKTVQGVRETISATQDKLGQIIAGAGGVYTTEEEQDDGSVIYYLHNKPELSDSETIWKMTSDAFGVSTDGGKTWNAGLTVDGEMITKILTTVGINANWINSGALNVTDDVGNVVFHVGIDDKTVILNGDSVFINSDGLTMGDAIDMAKTLSVSLSPNIQIVETNTDGSYSEFPETISTATVNFGRADITDVCTFSMRKSDGVECEFDTTTFKLTVTALKKDSAEIFLTANYLGIEATGLLSVIKQKDSFSITGIKNYYNVSDSNTTAPTEWVEDDIPSMTTEKRYLWSYEVTTYSDNTSNTTKPRVIGVYGDRGNDGTSITIISKAVEYAINASGTDAPSSDWETDVQATTASNPYLWTRTTVNYSDGSSTVSYSVSKNGVDGADGTSSYIHYAYANSADGKTDFSTSDSTNKSYIGVCTDSDSTDPTDYTKYSWTLIKGEDGKSASISATKNDDGSVTISIIDPATGATTTTVDKGADGTSISITEKSVTYATSSNGTTAPTSGWKTEVLTPTTDKPYLWTKTYVKYSDSSSTTAYSVSKYGVDGEDGKSNYIHYAYATSADGSTGFSTNDSTNKTYIGVCTDNNETDPTTASSYSWTLIKGSDGTNGKSASISAVKNSDGSVTITTVDPTTGSATTTVDKGSDGTSISIKSKNIAYVTSANGTTTPTSGWQTTVQTPTTDKPYLWTRTTVTYTDGTTDTPVISYSVSKYGFNGTNGTDSYVHIAYATNSDGSEGFSTTDPTGKTYIGIYTDSNKTDSTTASSYTWSLMKGSDGTSSTISAEKQTDGSVKITVTDKDGTKDVTVDKGADGTSISITEKSVTYATSSNGTTAPTSGWKTEVLTPTTDKPYLWTKTYVKYSDSSSTTAYSVSKYGVDGEDGISITSITEYYLATSKSSGVSSTDLASTEIPTISETDRYLWNCEVINFSDGTSSEKTTPVIIGVYGAKGKTGVGISSVTPLYYCSDVATNPDKPTATITETGDSVYNTWTKSIPVSTSTYQYFFLSNEVKYDDGTYWWTDVILDSTIQRVNNAQNTADEAANTASNASSMAESVNNTVQDLQKDVESDVSRIDSSITTTNTKIDDLRTDMDSGLSTLKEEVLSELNTYKASVEQYMKFNSTDGLILGANGKDGSGESPFKTVIDNTSMQFKQNNETVAYITNQQLNITSAVIEDLTIGNYVFHNRGKNQGLSIIWRGSSD